MRGMLHANSHCHGVQINRVNNGWMVMLPPPLESYDPPFPLEGRRGGEVAVKMDPPVIVPYPVDGTIHIFVKYEEVLEFLATLLEPADGAM